MFLQKSVTFADGCQFSRFAVVFCLNALDTISITSISRDEMLRAAKPKRLIRTFSIAKSP
jgi:hypothetical protein